MALCHLVNMVVRLRGHDDKMNVEVPAHQPVHGPTPYRQQIIVVTPSTLFFFQGRLTAFMEEWTAWGVSAQVSLGGQ
jgi:hypothetical protein